MTERKHKPRVSRAKKATEADQVESKAIPQNTSWGGVAEWYDRHLGEGSGTYQKDVVLPNLLRLMAIKPGTKVVDIACGQGFFAAAFIAAGADVKGADISPELVERARKNAPEGDFYVAPATAMPKLKSAWADHATINLALQNIDDARGALEECARIVKPGGKLHLVLNHPAFRIPRRSSWGWDRDDRQYRRLDGYLTESRAAIDMHPGAAPGEKTWSFHRPLQYYVKALSRAGFAVTNMEEWISNKVSDSGPRAPEENRARREFPLFMYVEATRQ